MKIAVESSADETVALAEVVKEGRSIARAAPSEMTEVQGFELHRGAAVDFTDSWELIAKTSPRNKCVVCSFGKNKFVLQYFLGIPPKPAGPAARGFLEGLVIWRTIF
jgi:hypothetical protein